MNLKISLKPVSVFKYNTLKLAGVIFFASMVSCNFFIENGGLGISLNIKDAKKRKVFVREYLPPQNPYKINNSLSINVQSAWLEHIWRYSGSQSKNAEIIDGYQLIIVSDRQSLKGHNFNWLIGIKSDSTFFDTFNNAIKTEFKTLPAKDTLNWAVQSGRDLNEIKPKIIGKFSLIAKRQ